MPAPYPFKMLEGERDDPPTVREHIAAWFACLTILLLSAATLVGILFLIAYLVWLYWPGSA